MFERYTEKARRTIFYSRYEASQCGSPYIETEHILLGLLREDHSIAHRYSLTLEQIRQEIDRVSTRRATVSTSVDLPLSNECKRVLAYAAEEAERLADKHIGTDHLFLGLLREEKSVGAELLQQHGVTLDRARLQLKADPVSPDLPVEGTALPPTTSLHGRPYRSSYLQFILSRYTNFAWQKQPWKARDILIDKATKRVLFYFGQEFDPSKFDLARGDWRRDHCAICSWPLYEGDDPEHSVAYTNGRDWVCTECHDKFLGPPVTPFLDLYT